MKILIVKTSSLGDIIHTLPALTDARNVTGNIRFDWVVEEAFAEIPAWHPAVDEVIPVAIRRWRKNWFKSWRSREWKTFIQRMKKTRYDGVIDAQGLIKSALLTRFSSAPVHGLDKKSAREPVASFFYAFKHFVPRNLHAVERVRMLFSKSLNYPLPRTTGKFNLARNFFSPDILPEIVKPLIKAPFVLFLHGTTRQDKHWPVEYWCELAIRAETQGFNILLPWGSRKEKERANVIASQSKAASVLPAMNLNQMASVIANARAVVAVDSGLGHLTAALDVPSVSLYGPTNPALIGTYGNEQLHLTPLEGDVSCQQKVEPAIFRPVIPTLVWSRLQKILSQRDIGANGQTL